jgi:diguanylate cyclase (GGDEF)-like protein
MDELEKYGLRQQLPSTIGQLKVWKRGVQLTSKTADIEEAFLTDPTLPGFMVFENDKLFGVLSRKTLLGTISRPFGREVYIQRPVSALKTIIESEPLRLPHSAPIISALRRAIDRPGASQFEPLLVDFGSYCAMLEMHELLMAQTNLLEEALENKERLTTELRNTILEQEELARKLSKANEITLYDATHDSLTGLPNRKFFIEYLSASLGAHRENPRNDCSVLFLDLDRFKLVNDSLGHLAGNELLKEVANRLTVMTRRRNSDGEHEPSQHMTDDIVARHSGDEFTILLAGTATPTAELNFADRVQKALSQPFHVGGATVTIGSSIGIVPSLAGYSDTDTILRDADIAMYRAKKNGKGRPVIYESTMHTDAKRRLRAESQLREAIKNKEFILYYHPIVTSDAGTILGAEALIRWNSPSGLMMPSHFIDIAEETGLIIPIDCWVFTEACKTAKRWKEMFPDRTPVGVSVNLSAIQFGQKDLPQRLVEYVEIVGISPEMITIEITERSAMFDPDQAVAMMHRLKSIGFNLALDDFGTGYSSLSYLHKFPVNILKVDKTFVENIAVSDNEKKFMAAILALCRTLGVTAIAEGVESEDQLEHLRDIGCPAVQGYLFGKPRPLDEIEQLFLTVDIPKYNA